MNTFLMHLSEKEEKSQDKDTENVVVFTSLGFSEREENWKIHAKHKNVGMSVNFVVRFAHHFLNLQVKIKKFKSVILR